MIPLTPSDPHRLGRYWLAGRLGAGGQGVVYEAYGEEGERVAVKVPRFDDPESRARLAREAAAAARVASFCTARIIEVGEPYIVSEFVPGPNLRQVIAEHGPYEGDTLRRLAIGVATALTAIHQAGVVHRDLKPDNIILGPDGPRVIDFGVAREAGPTTTGPVMGTPNYMAPEVLAGRGATAAADLWAWGLVVLFAARGEDAIEVREPVAVIGEVMDFRPDTADLADPLGRLVASALTKDPAARPSARGALLDLIGADGDPLSRGGALASPLSSPAEPDLGAIAEELYDELSEAERAAVPEVLLRMLDGDGSLRPVTRDELPETEAVSALLTFFEAAGLVTSTDESYELAKPALIQAWPRLRTWVADNREGLPVHRRLVEAAGLWDGHGRKPGDLLHGSSLDRTLQWAAAERKDLTLARREREFLDAAAKQTRSQSRRRGLLAAALAVLLVAALAGLGTAEYLRRESGRQRDDALAKSLALQAADLRESDPRLARLLTVAGWRLNPDLAETRGALYESLSRPASDVFTDPYASPSTVYGLDDTGRTLAAVQEGRVRLWDVRAHRLLREFSGVGTAVRQVALSPDGRTLAVLEEKDVRLWDVMAGTAIGAAFGGGFVTPGAQGRLAFDRAGRALLVPEGTGGAERAWDVATRKRLTAGSGAGLDAVDPARRVGVVSTGGQGKVELWNLRTGKRLPAPWLPAKTEVTYVSLSDDGRALMVSENAPRPAERRMRVWTVPGGGVIVARYGGEADRNAAFGFGDRYLAGWTNQGELIMWGRAGWPVVLERDLPGHINGVHFDEADRVLRYQSDAGEIDTVDISMLFDQPLTTGTPDGQALLGPGGNTVVITRPGETRMWDVATKRPLGPPIDVIGREPALAFSRDGGRLAVGDKSGTRIVDAHTARVLDTVKAADADDVAFSPDGRTLAISPNGPGYAGAPLELWNLAKGTATRATVPAPGTLAFRPDSRLLVAGVVPQPIDPATGTRLPIAEGLGRLSGTHAFSPDGRLIAFSGPDRMTLWDADLKAPVGAFPAVPGSAIQEIAWSPDGRTIATYEDGDRVRLWDVPSRLPLGLVFDGQKKIPLGDGSLAFSADGGTLYSAMPDGVVRTFPLDGGKVAAAVCRRAGRSLTEREWQRYLPEADRFDPCLSP
ncbi:WD40 repeat domain-containing serine/threonine-protein kinase [Nonomuraea sp. NPDC052129]|uniref:WD40 repeat domain-containing serine/threonine protein kinase n=1 Tax=Nonomuraea sp. NPDC052129 TaxID=3154651 RepID=UPI00342D6703